MNALGDLKCAFPIPGKLIAQIHQLFRPEASQSSHLWRTSANLTNHINQTALKIITTHYLQNSKIEHKFACLYPNPKFFNKADENQHHKAERIDGIPEES